MNESVELSLLLSLPFSDENADDEVFGLPSLQQCLETRGGR